MIKIKEEEKRFSKKVKKFLGDKIEKSTYKKRVEIGSDIQIIKDFTIGKMRLDKNYSDWIPIIGAQKQDLVIYSKKFDINTFLFTKEARDEKKITYKDVLIEFEGLQKFGIVIPLIIFELKHWGSVTTHEILKYSFIAQSVKCVFPHSKYYLVIDSEKRGLESKTLLRHGKWFDEIFLDWEHDKNRIWETIKHDFELFKRKKIL